ncbi:MAG: hypothetical protein FWF14_00655 [Streptococcaceae bacterium]|nr:hypothetical protein [Streptococcaceae bacterium]
MRKKTLLKTLIVMGLMALAPMSNLSAVQKDINAGDVSLSTVNKAFAPSSADALSFQRGLTAPSRPAMVDPTISDAASPTTFGYQNSIASSLTAAQKTQIVLFSATSATGALTVQYSGAVSSANLNTATNKIYTNNNKALDYVLYIGGNVTAPPYWSSQFSNNSTNFEAMNNRAKSITIINSPSDSLTTGANKASDSYTFTFPKGTNTAANGEPEIYLGCNTVFRNFTFQSDTATPAGTAFGTAGAGKVTIYGQGNKLALAGGSWCLSTLNVTGGTKNDNLTFNGTIGNHGAGQAGTNVWVASTGNCGTQIGGGIDDWSGSIQGDLHTTVVGVGSGGISTIAGAQTGSGGATITGSVYTDVRIAQTSTGNATPTVGAIWGGGNAVPSITGSIHTTVNSTLPVTYSQILGGSNSAGNQSTGATASIVSGSIYTKLAGQGKWAGPQGYFVGAGRSATVGATGNTGVAIYNDYDTSQFTGGDAIFTGGIGRQYTTAAGSSSGTINGGIVNYIKSGYKTGRVIGVSGSAGMDMWTMNANASGITNTSSWTYTPTQAEVNAYLNTTPAAADTKIAANADAKVSATYGNVYTWEQSGVMSVPSLNANFGDTTASYTRGGGFNGYIKGNTTVELGTANATPTTVGGAGLVTAAGWDDTNAGTANYPLSSNSATYKSQLANIANYKVMGGGGTTGSGSSLGYFQTGQATVIQNNVAAGSIFGGNASGILNGSSYNQINAGITGMSAGGGFQDLAQLGDAQLDFNNGQVDNQTIAAGFNSMGLSGNATANLLAPAVQNGNVYGFYGNTGNIVKGNTTVNITDSILNGVPGAPGARNRALNASLNSTGLSKDLISKSDLNRAIGFQKIISGGGSAGSVRGNANLNLSITPASQTGILPGQTAIAGAGDVGQGGGVGSGATNSTNLNLQVSKTFAQTGFLNSATIFGDASTGVDTKIGNNNITVNAIKNDGVNGDFAQEILATNYNIASSGGLTQTTNTNVKGLTWVSDISGGGPNDDFQNTTALGNANTANITIDMPGTALGLMVGDKIQNFTQYNETPNTTVFFGPKATGLINGGLATAATHGANYSNFGNVNLGDGAIVSMGNQGIGSLAKLTVGVNSSLYSPYWLKEGMFNLSDLDMSKGNLNWEAYQSAPPAGGAPIAYNGFYHGARQGYPVLTFTGGNSTNGIKQISPQNFKGHDFVDTIGPDGKNYPGDYDPAKMIGYVFEGTLNLQVPAYMDFGTHNLAGSAGKTLLPDYYGVNTPTQLDSSSKITWGSVDGDKNVTGTLVNNKSLVVDDTRILSDSTPWTLSVAETTPMTNISTGGTMPDTLWYSDGTNPATNITGAQTLIHQENSLQAGTYTLDKNWMNQTNNPSSNLGIYMNVPNPKSGQYQGTLTWTIATTP